MSDYDRHKHSAKRTYDPAIEILTESLDPQNLNKRVDYQVRPANAELPREAPASPVSVKHDQGKPDLSMTSYELMEAIARVREFGAKKYSRDNWKISGFQVTRSCAAALRHIFLFLKGETLDVESGLPHLAHAVCCLEHAIYDMKNHPENDDRYKQGGM